MSGKRSPRRMFGRGEVTQVRARGRRRRARTGCERVSVGSSRCPPSQDGCFLVEIRCWAPMRRIQQVRPAGLALLSTASCDRNPFERADRYLRGADSQPEDDSKLADNEAPTLPPVRPPRRREPVAVMSGLADAQAEKHAHVFSVEHCALPGGLSVPALAVVSYARIHVMQACRPRIVRRRAGPGGGRISHQRLRRHPSGPVTPPSDHPFDRGQQSRRARRPTALLRDREEHNGESWMSGRPRRTGDARPPSRKIDGRLTESIAFGPSRQAATA
jgi:hypothetical protein